MTLEQVCAGIQGADEEARQECLKKWSTIAKPLGSLGMLEENVMRIAALTGDAQYRIDKRAVAVLCADNGVVAQGVTQTDSSITALVAKNLTEGQSCVCHMAHMNRCDVVPVDIGINRDVEAPGLWHRKVAYGTKDLSLEPAMTREQAVEAILTGVEVVRELKEQGYKIIATGEMGIGNTTTSSAVAALLLDKPLETVTARGAGTPERVAHKIEVLRRAIALNQPDPGDPLDVLAKVGGLDIAALCGLYIGCAARGLAAFIDGVISGAAALCAARLAPLSREYMLPSHCSAEPAGRLLLEALGFSPLLTAGMCLGEGTGGALGALLLDQALAAYTDVVGIEDIGRRK